MAFKTVPSVVDLPISEAVIHNGLIYTRGHDGIDPKTGKPPEGIAAQTRQTLLNLQHTLERAGSSMEHVIKVNAYLTNLRDSAMMNDVYREFFSDPFPVRTKVFIPALAFPELIVELDLVAVLPE